MYINTTFRVDYPVEHEFKEWIKEVYLPALSATEATSLPRFMKILTDDEEMGACYAVLASFSLEALERWQNEGHPETLQRMRIKFGDKVMFFTTLMEEVY